MPHRHGHGMELRHLRYFVAVVDAGSLTVAAARPLHTRSAGGVEVTPAGRAFLDHARLVLSHVEAGVGAARRVADPAKPYFVLGFLTNQELTWMPETFRILRDDVPNIDVMISSQYSRPLANAFVKGTIDAAFLRREKR